MSHPLFSTSFDRALKLAAIVHARQRRKGTQVPYIAHPVHVARLLALDGQPHVVVLAGVLHDVLEDFDAANSQTRTELAEVFPELAATPDDPAAWTRALGATVEREFGAETRRCVEAVTEVKRHDGAARPWKVRKLEQLDHLRQADPPVAALKAADALHNVASILADLDANGVSVFARFKAPADETLWYYRTVAEIAAERLDGTPSGLAVELAVAVDRLASAVDATRP